MRTHRASDEHAAVSRLAISIARDAGEIEAAQRLRYRVFGEELGAILPTAAAQLDRDRFDPFCDHLLVRDLDTGEVVGTYRILPASRAALAGGFYTATEFDLGGLVELPGLVEVGRACIDRRHRNGRVLALLWAGLAKHLRASGHEHVMGCASIPAGDAAAAASVCARLLRDHPCPRGWQVSPRRPFPLASADPELLVAPPPLVRGYLRMGATVCGPPAWDPAFRTADLVMLLPLLRLDARFAQRFRRAA